MMEKQPVRRFRFGVFEADASSGELRRQGMRVRLHAQPFQLLLLLLERPGEVLTREEICRQLWPDDTFVDYEHGVNSAVNRLREALGDKATNPRFVETLARRGYRFVAPVERLQPTNAAANPEPASARESRSAAEMSVSPRTIVLPELSSQASTPNTSPGLLDRVLASPEDLPKSSHSVVKTLYILLQSMYLGFYVGALANLMEINELLSPLPYASQVFLLLVVTAAILIPMRAFLVCGVLFHAPRMKEKFLRLWPVLVLVDLLWALSPFLLLHHINYGLALACATLLVYAPFAQRSLILMGAGSYPAQSPPLTT